ncbi:hypothetical protein HanRHA438_Chr09g0421631 [Helianthus annuus]|nr:hypothetical protein HanRHA438_Chr09g0421631 [Helianthus annuus]
MLQELCDEFFPRDENDEGRITQLADSYICRPLYMLKTGFLINNFHSQKPVEVWTKQTNERKGKETKTKTTTKILQYVSNTNTQFLYKNKFWNLIQKKHIYLVYTFLFFLLNLFNKHFTERVLLYLTPVIHSFLFK